MLPHPPDPTEQCIPRTRVPALSVGSDLCESSSQTAALQSSGDQR